MLEIYRGTQASTNSTAVSRRGSCASRGRRAYVHTPDCRLRLLGLPLSVRCEVGCHGGADQLLEGGLVHLLPFAEVDRTPRIPLEARIEELRVFDGSSRKKVSFTTCLYDSPVQTPPPWDQTGTPRGCRLLPFPLLFDVWVGIVDQPADTSEVLSSPIRKLQISLAIFAEAASSFGRLVAIISLRFVVRLSEEDSANREARDPLVQVWAGRWDGVEVPPVPDPRRTGWRHNPKTSPRPVRSF